jgi:hypothetical protein
MSEMRRRELLARSASALLAATVAPAGRLAHAADALGHRSTELEKLSVQRGDDNSLLLSYSVRLDLPRDVEQALGKGVAVVFVAQAEVFRSRWYWTDQPRGEAIPPRRQANQPLTRRWRLSLDGLSRHYNSLADAFDAMRRTDRWRIADSIPVNDDQDYYVDFSFRLDVDELPRPLQIGLGGLGGLNNGAMDIKRRINVPATR